MNICKICGVIVPGRGRRKYCASCKKSVYSSPKKRTVLHNERAIAEVALRARREGMTYGKYVARYGI